MEDFDYIDALAQSELSNRTATPFVEGWANVQQKMKRKKRKKFLVFFLLFTLLCAVGIYQGINFNTDIDAQNNSITNKNPEINIHTDAVSASDSISDSDNTIHANIVSDSTSTSANNTSQAGTYSLRTKVISSKTKSQTVNTIQWQQSGIARNSSEVNSNSKNRNAIHNSISTSKATTKENQISTNKKVNFDDTTENYALNSAGLKLYPWKLITPEMLKKKRKKKKKVTKAEEIYENLDLMIGLNGFFTSNDYKLAQSYVVELSYTEEKKLKNDYYFNYGAALQFRNLRLKNDSLSFNSGELSLNILSNIEKRFGNFGIGVGAYIGYEFYSPNNEIFNNIGVKFFEQKINYGLVNELKYRKIALVFKYEFSPYINYLGNKKTGAFIIGVKYDF
jgi:hypothetical protein